MYEGFNNNEDKAIKFVCELENRCDSLSEGIIEMVCKRSIKRMNNWKGDLTWGKYKIHWTGKDSLMDGDFPKNFTFFDILSIQIQNYSYDEINPHLEDAIKGVLEYEYRELDELQRLVLDYSVCSEDFECNFFGLVDKIFKCFHEMLNEHWYKTKKITNFEISRSW